MSLYAIGDLHLGFNCQKPMDLFGECWAGHHNKIKENWETTVKPADTVIVAGDISWALTLEGAANDLRYIDGLPGRKILLKGNHDFWWSSLKKNREAFPRLLFLQNNYFCYEDYAIYGARGWTIPDGSNAEDIKLYNRESNRLELSLKAALKEGYKKLLCAMHFPPSNGEPSAFTDIIEAHGTSIAVYGHLHGEMCRGSKINFGMCSYKLVSADYLDFTPKLII